MTTRTPLIGFPDVISVRRPAICQWLAAGADTELAGSLRVIEAAVGTSSQPAAQIRNPIARRVARI
jgi:hypothetical protein